MTDIRYSIENIRSLNRFHICDGLALGLIRSWIEGIQQYQQYANTRIILSHALTR